MGEGCTEGREAAGARPIAISISQSPRQEIGASTLLQELACAELIQLSQNVLHQVPHTDTQQEQQAGITRRSAYYAYVM